MYDQTEVSYLDGDIVWVKLKSYWWPGQVVCSDKLPDDIQNEFKKKPLLAAVKFFQEDSFEFVTNHHQIYKYNCTQKENFIKKGLDKYRIKNKDGSNFMKKFPEDVKMAEILTGGHPHILLDNKFSPEKKPDISGLFGEKKMPKRKRLRDDLDKKTNFKVKVTHPRFLKENDHEIRIRQQPKTTPSSFNTSLNEIYPCHVCGFTSTRVNVIICHLKNHRSNKDTETVKCKYYQDIKLKKVGTHPAKRKYVRKSVTCKNTNEHIKLEIGKRKFSQFTNDSSKKKKSDPELREKLLADWNVDSDEDECLKSLPDSLTASKHSQFSEKSIIKNALSSNQFPKNKSDNNKLLQESNELLHETNDFIQLAASIHGSNKLNNSQSLENCEKSEALPLTKYDDPFLEQKSKEENFINENDDNKKLRLSCFDFDEDDFSESSITPVRKLSRSISCKNISIKKEMIKEFKMNQALQSDLNDLKISNTETKKNELTEVRNKCAPISTNGKFIKDFEDVSDNKIDDNDKNAIEIKSCHERKLDNFMIDQQNENVNKKYEENFDEQQKSFILDDSDCYKSTKFYDMTVQNSSSKFIAMEIAQNEKQITCEKQTEKNVCQEGKPGKFYDHDVFADKNKKDTLQEFNITSVSDSLSFENQKLDMQVHQDPAAEESSMERGDKINKLSIIDDINDTECNGSVAVIHRVTEHQNPFILKKSKNYNTVEISQATIVNVKQNIDGIETCHRLGSLQQHNELESNSRLPFISVEKLSLNRESGKTAPKGSEGHEKFESKSLELEVDLTTKESKKKVTANDSNESVSNINDATSRSFYTEKCTHDFSNLENNSCIRDLNINICNNENYCNVKEKSTSINNFTSVSKNFKLNNTDDKPYILDDDADLEKKNKLDKPLEVLDNNDLEVELEKKIEGDNQELNEIISHTAKNEEENTQLILHNAHVIMNDMKEESVEILRSKTTECNLAFIDDEKEKQESKQNISVGKIESAIADQNSDTKFNVCNNDLEKKIQVLDDCSLEKETNLEFFGENPVDHSNNEKHSSDLLNIHDIGNLKCIKNETETRDCNSTLNTEKNPVRNELIVSDETPKVRDVISTNVVRTALDLGEKVANEDKAIKVIRPPSLDSDVVPVKKREKPRIIENVTLKEPMILKTKLGGKHSGKINKHKVEHFHIKLDDSKCFLKTKIMKVVKTGKNVAKTIKNDARSNTLHQQNNETMSSSSLHSSNINHDDHIFPNMARRTLNTLDTKKFTKPSENVVNMEFDINSMPFVFSEDVLSAESIEQMPVVISSDLPKVNQSTSSLPQTLITPEDIKAVTNETFNIVKEVDSPSSSKKKIGTPTILKNQAKTKPMITSIKTIVPPLTSKIQKGNYKINSQPSISSGEKKSPGKYVIVQTSGQHTYSTHQKVTIPANENSANAQIVQQGSKVVIITPPQPGHSQTLLPFNSVSQVTNTKKIQKVMKNNESRKMPHLNFHCSNPSVTSKINQIKSTPSDYKFVNQKTFSQEQGSPKSILSSSLEEKSSIISNSSQNISIKESANSSAISSVPRGKKITPENVFVNDTSSQSGIRSKNISTLISSTPADQTITNPQSIISKGTVLTPITGSQVKAIAAKHSKGIKFDYKLSQSTVLNTEKHKNLNTSSSYKLTQKTPFMSTPKKILTSRQTNINKKNIKEIVKESIHEEPLSCKIKAQREMHQEEIMTGNVDVFKNVNQSAHPPKIVSVNTLDKSCIPCELPTSDKRLLKNTQKMTFQKQTKQSNSFGKMSDTSIITLPALDVSSTTSIALSTKERTVEKSLVKEEPLKEVNPENHTISQSHCIAHCDSEKDKNLQISNQTQFMVLPTDCNEDAQTYVFVTVNDQGHLIPLDDSSTISLNESSHSEDSKTVYIDSNTLCGSRNLDNIILHIDNSSFSAVDQIRESSLMSELNPTIETSPSEELSQNSNQDILAVALANTDFHPEVNPVETIASNTVSSVTQTSLISQTILQSTIIPPTEPISSPLVSETSLTLNQPIMTPIEVPSNVSCNTDKTRTSSIELSNSKSHTKICNISKEKSRIPINEDEHESPFRKKTEKKIINVEYTDIDANNSHENPNELNQVHPENHVNKKNEELSFTSTSVHDESIDINQTVISASEDVADIHRDYICHGGDTTVVKESNNIIDDKIVHLDTCKMLHDRLEESDNACTVSNVTSKKNDFTKSQIVRNDAYKKLDRHIGNLNAIYDSEKKILHQCKEICDEEKYSTALYKNNKQNDSPLEHRNKSKINTFINPLNNIDGETELSHENCNDSHFLSQCEIEKAENMRQIDNDVGQEKNLTFRSNDILSDAINTSVVNSVLNEDETASSSYIPDTPENQERDQDQDSAISTSSYEIPPCEELNITSSNIISASIDCEHSSIHNNGVLEIPTSPYTINPDSSTSCVDEVAESCYENQIIIESSVSTSYQVGISLPNFEEPEVRSHSFISSDSKNKEETSNFYHPSEMTESYFESICKASDSTRELKNDLVEKTLQYYENDSETISSAPQLYLNQEINSSFNSRRTSSNYYDSHSDTVLGQSYYPTSSNKSDSHSVLQHHEETRNFYHKKEIDEQTMKKSENITYSDKFTLESVSDSSGLTGAVLIDNAESSNSKSTKQTKENF